MHIFPSRIKTSFAAGIARSMNSATASSIDHRQ
jgi:hypothetical protein